MKGLREKFRKNEGFTLVEMLIVVAIIAILIAVSIPMVGTALEKSRHAVDQANERDAIALGTIEYLSNEKLFDGATGDTVELNYHVDENHQGILDEAKEAVEAECQCSETGFHNGEKLTVVIHKADGKVEAKWSKTNGTTSP